MAMIIERQTAFCSTIAGMLKETRKMVRKKRVYWGIREWNTELHTLRLSEREGDLVRRNSVSILGLGKNWENCLDRGESNLVEVIFSLFIRF